MTIDHKIRDEKLHDDVNRESARISALSSGKIDKCEYLIGEEILPSNRSQIIEQAKVTYSPLWKLWKRNKNNWRSRRKMIKSAWGTN